MQRLLTTLFLLACISSVNAAPNWYDNFLFKSSSFSFEFIRTLGYAYSQAADLGEAVATARQIKDGDIQSWYEQWNATAKRLYDQAEQFAKTGETQSSREAYFRASNYYRTAGLYMVAKADRPKSIAAYAMSKTAFIKGIASLPLIKPVQIPYGQTTLPGYFFPSQKPHAPLLIIHSGFDGTAEELYFEAGLAAHERGYHVLLFEGPGQGSVLRTQNITFRYDWEKVVTPVVNFALTLPGIDKHKIALMGISMGGFLAARACAFEHRLQACIFNGGVFSMAANLQKELPPSIINVYNTNPNDFDKIMLKEMQKNLTSNWFFNNAMWVFDAVSPSDVLKELSHYTLRDVIGNIKAKTLVIDSEGDAFFQGQPQFVYDKLNAPKTLLKFTAAESAQAHCQMGAISIANEKIFMWLDHVFK